MGSGCPQAERNATDAIPLKITLFTFVYLAFMSTCSMHKAPKGGYIVALVYLGVYCQLLQIGVCKLFQLAFCINIIRRILQCNWCHQLRMVL